MGVAAESAGPKSWGWDLGAGRRWGLGVDEFGKAAEADAPTLVLDGFGKTAEAGAPMTVRGWASPLTLLVHDPVASPRQHRSPTFR